MTESIKLISWNINANTGCDPKRLRRILEAVAKERPHILCLQEVPGGEVADALRQGLGERGLPHSSFSCDRLEKKHGVLTASHFDITDRGFVADAAIEGVRIASSIGSIAVFNAHVPNWGGNGWRKVYAMEALAEAVAAESCERIIVAGDFNEPKAFSSDGVPEPFGLKHSKTGEWTGEVADREERTHDLARWRDAVMKLLGPNSGLPLQHAMQSNSAMNEVVTHVTKSAKRDRFFDHILSAPALRIEDAGVVRETREGGPSDHSLVWAVLG